MNENVYKTYLGVMVGHVGVTSVKTPMLATRTIYPLEKRTRERQRETETERLIDWYTERQRDREKKER